jgi:hypothetical protein
MRRRYALGCGGALALGALFVVACADDRDASPLGVDAYIAETTGASPGETSVQEPIVSSATGDDAGVSPGDAAPSYDEVGCLTPAGASHVCGAHSDDSLCRLLASCDSVAISACRTTCERSASAHCWSPRDVECLRDAALARSCAALARCGVL